MNTNDKFSNQTNVAIDAILKGSIHVKKMFGKTMQEIGTEYKIESGDTPRTLIDTNTEKDITSIIRSYKEFRDDLINGEEEGKSGTSEKRTWFIDPFDGTSNAIITLPMSVSGIGIYESGKYTSSIILNPFEMKLYVAETGNGAYMATVSQIKDRFVINSNYNKLVSSKETDQKKKFAWIDALFNENTSQRKANWIVDMQKQGMMMNARMTGSNIDYSTKLAERRGHYQLTDAVGGYFDLNGACLIEESGGLIVNIEGKYPKPGDQVVIAVSNPNDLEKTLEITQKHYQNYQGFTKK